jgi:hypothetical protein
MGIEPDIPIDALIIPRSIITALDIARLLYPGRQDGDDTTESRKFDRRQAAAGLCAILWPIQSEAPIGRRTPPKIGSAEKHCRAL